MLILEDGHQELQSWTDSWEYTVLGTFTSSMMYSIFYKITALKNIEKFLITEKLKGCGHGAVTKEKLASRINRENDENVFQIRITIYHHHQYNCIVVIISHTSTWKIEKTRVYTRTQHQDISPKKTVNLFEISQIKNVSEVSRTAGFWLCCHSIPVSVV